LKYMHTQEHSGKIKKSDPGSMAMPAKTLLLRRSVGQAKPLTALLIVHEVLRSPGQPLDRAGRDLFEPRFGHDFSKVRVHTDSKANESAGAINAQAYTMGQDVVLAKGDHTLGDAGNKHLLAHELAHVVQQSQGGVNSQLEQRADAAAADVMRGNAINPALLGGASPSIQMKPNEQSDKPVKDKPTAAPNSWSKTLDKFAHNSVTLTPEHHKGIDTLAAEMSARLGLASGSKATIAIIGHTDTSGNEKYNEGLGLRRALVTKSTLEAALTKMKVGSDRIAAITVDSAGEKHLAKETPDNVREPLNRRVEIMVKIEGKTSALPMPTTTPSPYIEPPERKKPFDFNLPPDYKLPEEDWWKRTERERKIIEEYDRTHPARSRSLTDVLVEGVTKALEPIIKKLPDGLRDKAREGIRKGIEAGTEKACEAAIDASGVTGNEADALKAACKAALKTRPGEKQ
jgi:outer membrane protein OmpA-like peptidoglycan-associated protein